MCWLSLSVFILYFLASFILFIYLHLVTTTVCDGCNRPEIRSCLCLTGSRFRDFHCSSSSSSHLWYIWESPSPGKPQKQKKKKTDVRTLMKVSPFFFLLPNRDLTSPPISYYVSWNQRGEKKTTQNKTLRSLILYSLAWCLCHKGPKRGCALSQISERVAAELSRPQGWWRLIKSNHSHTQIMTH